MVDATTMERLVPDELMQEGATGSETLKLHLERYEFAAQHVKGPRILDLACGVGYGSRLLRDRIPEATVTGLDLSESAVSYAKSRYAADRLDFLVGNAM